MSFSASDPREIDECERCGVIAPSTAVGCWHLCAGCAETQIAEDGDDGSAVDAAMDERDAEADRKFTALEEESDMERARR